VARLIRRYENRKLYDVAGRRYVSIEDLARLIVGGEDVHVEDRGTGEDITSVVLAQVVLDRLKEKGDSVPRQVLTRLIRLGAGPVSAWSDFDGQEAAARARAEAERIASEVASSVQRAVADAQGAVEARLRHWLPGTGAPPAPRGPRRGAKTTSAKKTTRRKK
jgi:polyhydroxyalkanoate synthesis repressor PhaR